MEQLYRGINLLQDENLMRQLETIEKQLGEQTFNLPLIGQFSAGKSMLLNNLLGEEILPVKVTETTAFITYIAYGEVPQVIIRYKDDTEEEVSLEYLKNLHQIQVDAEGEKLKQIKDIKVKYPSPFLEKGLCLVDTPGVNTLFVEHEALTKAILEDTYYMLYVMAKPLTQFDMQFIKSIMQTGVRPIFIRTGIDQIKSSEESLEEALAKEKMVLTAQFGQAIDFYPITNKYQELNNLDFTCGFEAMRHYLQYEIIANREQLKVQALEGKLEYLKKLVKEKLVEKQAQLQVLISKDEMTLTKALEVVEQKIYKLELESTILERECQKEFTDAFEDLKERIVNLKSETVNSFYNWLEMKMYLLNLSQIDYEAEAMAKVQDFRENIKVYAEELIENTIKDRDKVYTEIMDDLNSQMETTLGQDFNLKVDTLDAEALLQVEAQKREALRREIADIDALIQEKEAFIEGYYNEAEGFEEIEIQLKSELMALNEELKALNSEEIPYIYEEGNTTASDILGGIGNLADWALMFVPGLGSGSAAKQVATTAQKVSKISKVCRQGNKVNKVLQNTIRTIKVKNAINKAHQTYKNIRTYAQTTEEPGISKVLDYLSVEFYCRKLGQCFDTPPIHRVDPEALADQDRRRAQLNVKHQTMIKMKMENLEKSNALKSQADREMKLKALKEEHKLKLEQELIQLDEMMRKEQAQKENAYLLNAITTQFKEMIQSLSDEFEGVMWVRWQQLAQEYINNRMANMTEQLENLHEELAMTKEQKTMMLDEQAEIKEVLEYIA